MANVWLVLVKKHTKAVAAEAKAGKFKGKVMVEAIKRAKAEYLKSKGKTETKDDAKKEDEESEE